MFWNLFWPIALITLANCFYNICTKAGESFPLAVRDLLNSRGGLHFGLYLFSVERGRFSGTLETQLDGADARFGSGSLRSRLHPYVSCRMENQHGFFGD